MMRSILRLCLIGAPLFVVDPAAAQRVDDVCPLASRGSSARGHPSCRPGHAFAASAATIVQPPDGEVLLHLLPFQALATLRTGYSAERERGPLWAGRGVSGALSGGVAARFGPLLLALEPVVHGSENRSFSLPDTVARGRSRYADPWFPAGLDRFLRPGGGPTFQTRVGESVLALDAGPVEFGLSNERMVWGAPRRYPLLFSGNAPGFPHVYVEAADMRTVVGTFEAEVLVGHPRESRFYDADSRNDTRVLTALRVGWAFEDTPGLEVEFELARHGTRSSGSAGLEGLPRLIAGNEKGSGTRLGLLGFRIAPPESGLEAYAQVGRGRYFLNTAPGGSDVASSSIHTLGFARTVGLHPGAGWRVRAEVSRQALELPQPRALLAAPVEGPIHGHTHDGRYLGSPAGPGSDAQFVEYERFAATTRWGVFAERIRHDDDAYYRVHAPDYGVRGHDVEWGLGVEGGQSFSLAPDGATVSAHTRLRLSRRKNRDFVGLDNGTNRDFLREWDLGLDLYLSWDPGLSRRVRP